MTGLLMGTGILLVGVVALLVARAVALPRIRLDSHLRTVESYGFAAGPAKDSGIGTGRGWLNARINGLAEGVGRWLICYVQRVPALRRAGLAAAGYYAICR